MKRKGTSKLSKQVRYQRQREQDGKCRQCGDPATDGPFCDPCVDTQRRVNRENYRRSNGIPFDAPLMPGRPRRPKSG